MCWVHFLGYLITISINKSMASPDILFRFVSVRCFGVPLAMNSSYCNLCLRCHAVKTFLIEIVRMAKLSVQSSVSEVPWVTSRLWTLVKGSVCFSMLSACTTEVLSHTKVSLYACFTVPCSNMSQHGKSQHLASLLLHPTLQCNWK